VKRIYNPADDNPIEIFDASDNSKKEFQINHVFPILFLSQNEVIRIAEDKTGGSQRMFIDRFFDFYRFQHVIEELNTSLNDVDRKFAESIRAHLESQGLQKKIATYREEIEKLGRQIHNKAFEEYSKKEKIGRAINNQIVFLNSLKESIANLVSEYKDLAAPLSGEKTVDDNPAVKRTVGISNEVIHQITDNARLSISFVEKKIIDATKELTDWKLSFDPVKIEYEKVVKESGGNQIILDQKRKTLMKELSRVEQELTKYQTKAAQVKTIADKRNEIIAELEKAYSLYYEERKRRCEYFTRNSSGSLNVAIMERGDTSAFKGNLLRLKKGTWLKDEDIDVLSKNISPKDFVDAILRYEWQGRQKKDLLKEIADKTKMDIVKVEKLVQHLLDNHEYIDLMALLYSSAPNDVPSIKYRVGSDYKALDELSVGQKAVALLIIALTDGNFPIIIDQPEDSLDLRTIWDDVCSKLRGSKDRRQFIFTTHNSSVAVASDTDKFTILQADAIRGKILYSGSINRHDIKREVIDYLEGGKETYDTKRGKYNI
jgi:hypothetical protein